MAGGGQVPRLVDAHVAAFDEAVASGRWEEFSERFTEAAVMGFVGVPVGPFRGRAAIAAAYAADPPREPLVTTGPVVATGPQAVVPFRWADSGGTGTMRLTFAADGLVEELVVSFDAAAAADAAAEVSGQGPQSAAGSGPGSGPGSEETSRST